MEVAHMPEKRVPCPYCDRTYNHSSALRTHIVRSHRAEDERANEAKNQRKLTNLMKLMQTQ